MNKKEINDKINKIKESINKIDINIYTNIGGEKTDAIPFTKSLFVPPLTSRSVRLEEQPFFSTDYIIPYEILENGSKENKMNTLFNKEKFTQFIYKNATKVTELSSEGADENVKSLLKVLFPTYYPIRENHTDTYNELIKGASPAITGFPFTLPPFRKLFDDEDAPTTNDDEKKTQPLQEDPINFTYLTIGGKVYTVIKVVYLNDFINNPKYSKIIDTYKEFVKLEDSFDRKIEWELSNAKRELLEKLYDLFMDMNLPVNICDYKSSLHSQYEHRDGIQHSSRYISIKKRNDTILEIERVFNKFVFEFGLYKANITNEQEFNTDKCINKFARESRFTDKKIISLTTDEVINYVDNSDDKETPNDLWELNKNMNNLASSKNEINNKYIKVTEHGIYNLIIRNISLTTEQDSHYKTYIKTIDNDYDKYLEFLKIIDPIFTGEDFTSDDRVKFPSVFKDSYSKISKLYKNVKLYADVFKYKESGYRDSISSEVTDYIKQKYPDISKFTELIRMFTYPNRESFNKLFTDMLINYTQLNTKKQRSNSNSRNISTLTKVVEKKLVEENKTNPKSRFRNAVGSIIEEVKPTLQTNREQALTDFLKSIDDDLLSNSIPLYNTGLDLYYTPPSGKSKYEIHIYMDLVEGKLTKDILSKTSCFFKDNQLVNLFYKLRDKGIGTGDYVFTNKSPVIKVPDLAKLFPAKSGGKLHTVTRKYKKRKGVKRPLSRRRLCK